MSQLPYSIELHDSRISEIYLSEGNAYIHFAPAYIHKDGKGWSQDVEVIIYDAKVVFDESNFPVQIYDGWLKTNLGPYHNLLEIPFSTVGPVEMELEVGSGNKINVVGNGIDHIFKGELTFIEIC